VEKIEMKPLLIQSNVVMNGFCWAHSNALLQKLKSLNNKRQITNEHGSRTDITAAIMNELSNQIGHCPSVSYQLKEGEITSFINHVEEFLAIFEKKE